MWGKPTRRKNLPLAHEHEVPWNWEGPKPGEFYVSCGLTLVRVCSVHDAKEKLLHVETWSPEDFDDVCLGFTWAERTRARVDKWAGSTYILPRPNLGARCVRTICSIHELAFPVETIAIVRSASQETKRTLSERSQRAVMKFFAERSVGKNSTLKQR